MTLEEYCRRNKLTINRNEKTGATHLTLPAVVFGSFRFWELWRLADYAVSTISGPVVWLVPR